MTVRAFLTTAASRGYAPDHRFTDCDREMVRDYLVRDYTNAVVLYNSAGTTRVAVWGGDGPSADYCVQELPTDEGQPAHFPLADKAIDAALAVA